MPELTLYRWWAVDCATKDCETTLLLCPIGPSNVYAIPMLKECAPFKETCPTCGIEHTYFRARVKKVDTDAPPIGFQPSRAFLKAIQPKEPETSG